MSDDLLEKWFQSALKSIEKQEQRSELHTNLIHKLETEIDLIKLRLHFKSGFYGALGGSLPMGLYILFQVLSK